MEKYKNVNDAFTTSLGPRMTKNMFMRLNIICFGVYDNAGVLNKGGIVKCDKDWV